MADPLDIFGVGPDPLDLFGAPDEDPLDPMERMRRNQERLRAAGAMSAEELEGGQGFWGAAGERALSAWKSGYTGLADLATRSRMMPTTGPLKSTAERAEEDRKREMGEFAEASTRAGLPPVATAAVDTLLEAVDPLDIFGGVVGSIAPAARLLRRGARAAPAAAPVADDLAELGRRSLAIGEEPGSALSRARATDAALEEAGETGLRGSETPIGREGRLRPPETPFQYNAESLDLPASALPEIRETMGSEKILTRRRTGLGIDYDDPAKLRAEVGMAEEDFIRAAEGTVWNREQQELLKAYIGKWGRKLEELRPGMREDMAKGLESSPAINAFADVHVKYLDLLAADMAHGTEAGRVLEARKHLMTALDSPESLRAYLGRKLGDKLTEADKDLLTKTDLANPEELVGLLRRVVKPKWSDYPVQMFMNNILTSVGSFGRDAVGNGIKGAAQIPVRVGGALLDAPLSKLHGRPRQRYLSEVLPQLWGMKAGFEDGLKRSWAVLSRDWFSDPLMMQAQAIAKDPAAAARLLEAGADEAGQILEGVAGALPKSKIYEGGLPAMRRAKSAFVRTYVAPFFEVGYRGHGGIDQFAKGINEGSELRVLAYRSAMGEAKKSGLSGDAFRESVSRFLKDPPPEAIEEVTRYGLEHTYQLPLGKFGQGLQRLVHDAPPLRFIIPFIRTSTNIFKEAGKFTPFNVPRSVLMAVRDDPRAAEELTKTAMGTMLMGWGWMKAMSGEIVGEAPKDQAERDAFYQQKKKPFSIRVGDTWYQFSQMEPFGMPLSLIASAWDGVKNSEPDATTFERLQKSFSLMIASQLDKSYFSGLADLAELREGRGEGSAFVGRQLAALAIPEYGMLRSVANFADTRIVERDSGFDYAIEAIPGAKGALPARQTRFGEDIHRTRWEAIGPVGTAAVPSRVTDDEVERSLEELGLRVGFPGRSIEGVALDKGEYREYLARVGPKTKETVAFLLREPSFRQFDQATQQRVLDKFVQDTRDAVRTEAALGLVPGIPPLMVKKQLAGGVDFFNSARSRVDGISAGYNERTRNRGQVGVGEMFEAGEKADEAWGQAYSGLQQSVSDARRQGLTDEQIVGLLRRKGISHRVARAIVDGKTMTYQHYRERRGDF